MSLSKYSKRRGQFEALEAKQLFAADLVGGAAADLADTAVVAGYEGTENHQIFDPGAAIALPDTAVVEVFEFEHGDVRFPYILGYQERGENAIVDDSLLIGDHNLGGQEGEDAKGLNTDMALGILVDHVFEQYAEEIGVHNTQWDFYVPSN